MANHRGYFVRAGSIRKRALPVSRTVRDSRSASSRSPLNVPIDVVPVTALPETVPVTGSPLRATGLVQPFSRSDAPLTAVVVDPSEPGTYAAFTETDPKAQLLADMGYGLSAEVTKIGGKENAAVLMAFEHETQDDAGGGGDQIRCLHVVKNMHGTTGWLPLRFRPYAVTFEDLSDREYVAAVAAKRRPTSCGPP